jgi:hypothetical protein
MDEDAEKESEEHRKREADIRLHAHRMTDAACRVAMVSVAENYERLATAMENSMMSKRSTAG